MRFSLRVDAVAALRDLLRGEQPSPAAAALAAAHAGADAVTVRLRGDRQGTRDADLDLFQKGVGLPFHLDIAPTRETVKTVLLFSPATVTLVPERRDEPGGESAIDVALTGSALESTVRELRDHGVAVYVLVDPDLPQIRAAHRIGVAGVRLSTRPYALSPGSEAVDALRIAAQAARKVRIDAHAGGGLDYGNVGEVARIEEIRVLHAGGAVLARALFLGLDRAIRDFCEALS